uniref:hypothetical protein n=1 Tax=Prevotella sp. TaxID=59823 RepID=UPI0040274179
MWQLSSIEALQQQRLLLQLEYFTESEAFRKQTDIMGMIQNDMMEGIELMSAEDVSNNMLQSVTQVYVNGSNNNQQTSVQGYKIVSSDIG